MKEHDADSCSICKGMGNYAEQADIFSYNWMEAHRKAGIAVETRFGVGFTYAVEPETKGNH